MAAKGNNNLIRDFPLYDSLREEPNTSFDKNAICRTIASLDENHTNIIYALILHHYILTSGNKPTAPYGAVTYYGGRGIRIMWSNIPLELQHIIAKYIDKNRKQ